MKTLLSLSTFLLCFGTLSAHAAATSFFAPTGQAIVTIKSPTMGAEDPDAANLWLAMNVPVQEQNAKGIVTPGKELNFICKKAGGKADICFVTMNERGPQSKRWLKVDYLNRKAQFLVEGDEAAFFTDKIVTDQGEFSFATVDRKFFLSAKPGRFEILYSEKGL